MAGPFDYSGVGAAMPEAYGANAPVQDPFANALISVMRNWRRPDTSGETVRYKTASPLVNITDEDINRAVGVGLGATTGPLSAVRQSGLSTVFPLIPGKSLAETRAILNNPPAKGLMPELAERYPETAPYTLKYKSTDQAVPENKIPTGPELERRLALPKTDPKAIFKSKTTSPEAKQLTDIRAEMKPDIEAGNYEPYFNPAERADVDPAPYGAFHETTSNLKKKPATREQYDAMASHPDAVKRLEDAYARGLGQKDAAGNWYFMKQLEDEFVKEYGQAQGQRLFKERFADAMAATTGGADPTANLLMAHYGNYLKQKGLPVPESNQFPYPIGGQYAAKNMDQFRKMIMEGEGINPLLNEKRYNFSGNFLGRKGATIDEQMSALFKPGMEKPPADSYGHFEKVLGALAAKHGVDPRYFQEVAWAGAKDLKTPGGYTAKPMIAHVNDSIERTHRITGLPREEIVRRGLVRAEIPLYGAAGAVGLDQMNDILQRYGIVGDQEPDKPNSKDMINAIRG